MNPLVNLAKLAVKSFVKEGKIISAPEGLLEGFLKKKSGTFVTIMKGGALRGCIGTYLPTKENIAKEIISNAIAAATEDYRFGPIQEEELPYLEYTVYILSEPELVKDIFYPPKSCEAKLRRAGLDPKKYGIIVKTIPITHPNGTDVVFNGHVPAKTGLLLPDLESIDGVEKQIAIACQKGGIDLTKEKIIIYRFSVEKYQ